IGGLAQYDWGDVSLLLRDIKVVREETQGGCDALASSALGDLENKE
ncbi:hypothetical protein A2U01_0090016, partial [Trifolium medium]|nr:hypothetical protein [Trifolium medium]